MSQTPEQQKAYKRRRNERGLCSACNNPIVPGRTLCQAHIDKMAIRNKERKDRLKAAGLCCSCGKHPSKGTSVLCAECIARRTAPEIKARARKQKQQYAQMKKQAGICTKCSRPVVPGKKSCEHHLAYAATRAQKLQQGNKKRGLCPYCGNKPIPGKVLCEQCRQRSLKARRRNKFGGNWQPALERDGYKCQICGSDKDLDMHHIDGQGEDHPIPNHAIDNLITLCSGCHSSITKFRSPSRNKELVIRLLLA